MRASILLEMDKEMEAIASLKQAIYIDQDYLMGHFTLGNLFVMQGNTKLAKRYFDNALQLLSKLDEAFVPPDGEGLSVKYMKEIILANSSSMILK